MMRNKAGAPLLPRRNKLVALDLHRLNLEFYTRKVLSRHRLQRGRPGRQSRRGVASTTKRLNHVKTRLRTPRPTVTRRQTVKHRDNLVRNNNRNLHRKVLESNVTEKMMDDDFHGNAPSKFPDAAREGIGS